MNRRRFIQGLLSLPFVGYVSLYGYAKGREPEYVTYALGTDVEDNIHRLYESHEITLREKLKGGGDVIWRQKPTLIHHEWDDRVKRGPVWEVRARYAIV